MRWLVFAIFSSALPAVAATTIYCVDNSGDPSDTTHFAAHCANDCSVAANGGQCSLREAILQFNAHQVNFPNVDEIDFRFDPGAIPVTITLATELPPLQPPFEHELTINGYSQPGSAAATALAPASLQIILSGSESFTTLTITPDASGSRVQGLVFNHFATAIAIEPNTDSCTINGNFIGINQDGTTMGSGNIGNSIGIEVASDGNLIGGYTADQGNVVDAAISSGAFCPGAGCSGTNKGIEVSGNSNFIGNNYVGLDASGLQPPSDGVGNFISGNAYGIEVLSTGDTNTIERNTVAASTIFDLTDSGISTQITRNNIGVSVAGTDSTVSTLNFGGNGIHITGTANSFIGSIGNGNIIANHAGSYDLQIASSGGVTISHNVIGIDSNGASLGSTIGVHFVGASGTNSVIHNAIGGASQYGIDIDDSSGVTVSSNFIGLAADGTTEVGNSFAGVIVENGSAQILIGGSDTSGINTISGNGFGIDLEGGDAMVAFNVIGLDGAGAPDGNSNDGVRCNSTGDVTVSTNVISANGVGITVLTGSPTISDNFIGTDASGEFAIGNNGDGIFIQTTGGVLIKGHNLISANDGNGIEISQADAGVTITGAIIGTDWALASSLGNNGAGISYAVPGVIVGGNGPSGNVIAFNNTAGVSGAVGVPVVITGNDIYGNNTLGIDESTSGMQILNDDPDADGTTNYPTPVSASGGGNASTTTGTLTAIANRSFAIDVFSNPGPCDTSMFGQGTVFLGSAAMSTDGTGQGTFSVPSTVFAPDGSAITTTATLLDTLSSARVSTSEFSSCVTLRKAGTLSWDSASLSVDESAGSVSLTLDRTDGSTGAIMVDMTTADGSAMAGLDYTSTSTTLDFADGETSKTVGVELLPHAHAGDVDFTITLSNATNGAAIGSAATATITVSDADFGTSGGSTSGSTGTVGSSSGSTSGGTVGTSGGSTSGGTVATTSGSTSGSGTTSGSTSGAVSSSGGSTAGASTGSPASITTPKAKTGGCHAAPSSGEYLLSAAVGVWMLSRRRRRR